MRSSIYIEVMKGNEIWDSFITHVNNHHYSSNPFEEGTHLVGSTIWFLTISSHRVTYEVLHKNCCDFLLDWKYKPFRDLNRDFRNERLIWVCSHFIHQLHGYYYYFYCQWYLVSKHNSTHTKRVCYIIIDVGSLREPFCYKPRFLTTSLTLSMNEKFFCIPCGRYLWGVGITAVNTTRLQSECYSSLLASFYVNQYECKRHSTMDFGSGPKRF